ncbi:MAG: DsbA family protein [Campylobacteraceae bacterium]|jgi:protein-disulfide isomerase|nr:DsbA family protein [Campylobacteraceae bacterium]
MNTKALMSSALIILLLLFSMGIYFYNSHKAGGNKTELDSVLIREHSYILGDENAKVTVVEFFDPACPACVAKAPAVARLPELYNSQVRVVYRSLALHNGSEVILSLMEAAKVQGKYKEASAAFNAYYGSWFSNNQVNSFIAWNVLERTGTDMEKVRTFLDENQSAIDSMLRQNMEDATALGVNATPTFFVNGVKVEQNELIRTIENEIIKANGSEK